MLARRLDRSALPIDGPRRRRAPACGDDDDAAAAAVATGAVRSDAGDARRVGRRRCTDATSASRSPSGCEANQAAGTITYLSSFDFAAHAVDRRRASSPRSRATSTSCASTSTCKPSFSTANYPLVAANQAQFCSAGSFTEMLTLRQADGADFVAVVDVRQDERSTRSDREAGRRRDRPSSTDLEGKTIGVKGELPPAIVAMLHKAGLVEGSDYRDRARSTGSTRGPPRAADRRSCPCTSRTSRASSTGPASPYKLFDPSDDGIPGSFGILYTNGQFLDDHPSAAQDFVRASLKGMEDAIADPDAAVAISRRADQRPAATRTSCRRRARAFRWEMETELIVEHARAATAHRRHRPGRCSQAEVDAYTEAGVFDDGARRSTAPTTSSWPPRPTAPTPKSSFPGS